MDNNTKHPDAMIEELDELSESPIALIRQEVTGSRRLYTCYREIVRRDDGSIWALEWNGSESHAYATDAYEVEPTEVTVTKYHRRVSQ